MSLGPDAFVVGLVRVVLGRRLRRWCCLMPRIVPESADGQAFAEVVRRLGITADTVRVWGRRLLGRRFDGLCDGHGPVSHEG